MTSMLLLSGQLHTVLLVILCALQVADLLTTYIALASGHAHEANPLLVPVLRRFGWRLSLLFIKVAAVALLVAVNHRFGIYNGVLVILVLLYGYVVYHNYLVGEE